MVQQPLTVQRIAPPPLSLLPLAPPQKADLYHFSSAYAQEDDDDGHRRTSCSSTTTIQVQVKKSPKLGGGEETFTATAEVGPNGTVVKQSQSKGWGRLFGFGGKGGKKARNAVTHDDEACNGPRLNVDVAAEAARRAMIQNLAYMPMPLPPSAANIVVMNDRNADLGAMPDLIFASSTQTTTTTQCSAEGVTTTVTTSMTVAAPVSKGWFGKKKESLHLTDGSTPAAAATPASAPTAAHKPAAALPAEEVDPTKASAEIEKLGWGWGSGAQRIWGPSVSDQAQKRFSEIKDNEGNVLAAQTTVDRSLVPRDSQQVENWKPFVEAYKRGDLDLNNLPAPPNKGVPDASLCPDASPVDCGPLLAPMPEWEKERQLALNRLQFDKLDAARKERIDGYVQELQGYMGTSMSMLALLDEDKMLLPSSCGMGDLKEAPREISICGHTILNRNDGMVVLDVGNDWRFKGGQVSKMGIGFYAGIPVTAANGLPLGSLCALDSKPRQKYTEEQRTKMRHLATLIGDEIEQGFAERFEAKLGRMEESFGVLEARMKEQFTSPKMGTASAPAPAPAPTPAAEDDKTTSISPVVMDKTQGGMEVVNLPPAAQATSGNRATIDLEKTASLGILMTDADLSRVNLAAQLVSETIEVDTVYLVAVSPSSSDNDQACVLLAAHGMPIPAPRLDPVLHSRALARAGGLLYQNPEKSELEEDDPGLPICADVDGESYHAGLLVPVHLSPVSPSGSASFNSTSPPNSAKTAVDSVSELGLGLVLVALTTDPKRVLGIEDLRYLESFGNVIGPMVQKCLKASIEAARKEKEEAQARDAVQAKEDKKGRRKTALKGLGLSKKRSKGDLKTSTAHAHPNAHLQRSPATERGNPTDNFGSNFDGASLLNAPTPSVGPASPDSAPAPAPTGALPTRPSEPIRSKSFAAPKSWRKSKGPEQIAVAVPAA